MDISKKENYWNSVVSPVEKSHRTTIWNLSRFFAVTKNETQQNQLHKEKASYSSDQVETPYFRIIYMSRIPIQQTILIS